MTESMEENIKKLNNIHYFIDVTYYSTPPFKSKYKLLVILSFNKDLFRAILCNLSLIANENIETFITVFEYLKAKYNFNPKKLV